MEAIGDSTLVDDLQVGKLNTQELESIEFERNLDDFRKTLEHEENRLVKMEEQRVKILQEIDELCLEIAEEKKSYRKALDDVMVEHEKVSREFIESCNFPVDLSPNVSSMSLFEACADTVASTKNLDYNIELDIEKIRCDLMESYIATKEDYLSTVKAHLQQKKKKLGGKTEADESNVSI